MKPQDWQIVDVLFPKESSCFQIPPFQRNYQWQLHQVHRLAHDIDVAAHQTQPHWLGVALFGKSEIGCTLKNRRPGHVCYDILDGQQRFITLRIWLVALLDEYLRQTGEQMEGYPREDFTTLTVHGLDQKNWDRLHSFKILDDRKFPSRKNDSSIPRTYWYFRRLLLEGSLSLNAEEPISVPSDRKGESKLLDFWLHPDRIGSLRPISPNDLREFCRGTLENLSLTTLTHQAEDEPVEVIFETLNSERQPMMQFDLFRNSMLIESAVQGQAQRQLYEKFIKEGETEISDAVLDIRGSNLDRFLYDFLIGEGASADSGTIKIDATAQEFKKYWVKQRTAGFDVETFFETKLTPSMGCWLAAASCSGKIKVGDVSIELDGKVNRSLLRIENLSKGPFTPLTSLLLRSWYEEGNLHNSELLLKQLHLLETYVVRYVLSGKPLSPLRRMMMGACVEIFGPGEKTLKVWVEEHCETDERLRNVLTQSCSRDGKETDSGDWILESDFAQRLESRQIRAIFDGLNAFLEGSEFSTVLVDNPAKRDTGKSRISVEHFYPQKPDNWLDDLARWGVQNSKMSHRLHALGNITVVPVPLNSKMSNKSLNAKQKEMEELAVPHWRTNKKFLNADKWTQVDIDNRTRELVEQCLLYWSVAD